MLPFGHVPPIGAFSFPNRQTTRLPLAHASTSTGAPRSSQNVPSATRVRNRPRPRHPFPHATPTLAQAQFAPKTTESFQIFIFPSPVSTAAISLRLHTDSKTATALSLLSHPTCRPHIPPSFTHSHTTSTGDSHIAFKIITSPLPATSPFKAIPSLHLIILFYPTARYTGSILATPSLVPSNLASNSLPAQFLGRY